MPKPTVGLANEETEYERTRRKNMESNQKMLQELMGSSMNVPDGLNFGMAILEINEPKPKPKKAAKPKAPKPKVKKEEEGEGVEREERGTRRSARQASKPTVSYAGDGDKIVDRSKMPRMVSRPDKNWDEEDSDEGEEGEGKVRVNKLVGRVHDPKTFGLIPGVPIGSWWETRAECSAAAIHAPFVAGISGGPEGAYSVALSGGYDDDIDMGDAFTYTGSGGRDLKGTAKNPKNLRTAPQSSHQSFEHSFNKALKVSSETRKPVRVIRGFKLPGVYAPETGYRYDGLYIVERAWMDRGNNPKGWQVCKFAFRRIPGQPPIPRRGETSKATKSQDVEMEDVEEEEEEEGGEEEEEEEEEEKSEGEEEVDKEEEEEPEEKPKRGRKAGPKSKAKVGPKSKAKAKQESGEEQEEGDEPEEEEEKQAPAKKGRKAGSKSKVEEESGEEKPKKGGKVGTKSRVKAEEEEEEEAEEEVEPKEDVEPEEEEEEEPEEEKPAPAKKGRKVGLRSKAQKEPDSQPASKRGRKPKVQSEPEEEEENVPPAKKTKVEEGAKKRGRPAKK